MAERHTRGLHGVALAAGRLVPLLVFGVLPLAFAALYLVIRIRQGVFGYDFGHSFWPAGRAVLHGTSPYPPLDPAVLAKKTAFVYPPIVAIVLAPFALLPVNVATVLAVVVTAASLPAALWVLGVRDWRCYTIALASPPMLACIQTAAISAPLALLIALAWRGRASGLGTPAAIVLMIAAKLFLWPLLIWLALVRGVRCAALTACATAVVVVGPWLAGFPGFDTYPRLLSMLTDIEATHAYTPRSLAESLGATARVGEAVAIVAGGALLLLELALRGRPDADRHTLVLTLLAALLLSPIVWSHYLLVLYPPIAIARRRLSGLWFVPWGMFLAGDTWLRPSTAEISVALGVMLVIALLALRSQPVAIRRFRRFGLPRPRVAETS